MKEQKQTVFQTKWFNVEQVSFPEIETIKDEMYYRINSADGVLVLATTAADEIILVRQFRPALGKYTLEFPAGGVDPGETPEYAARRELLEETGYDCQKLESLGSGHIMLNRHKSLLHSYFARGALQEREAIRSAGVETHLVSAQEFKRLVLEGGFDQYAALALLPRIEWQLGIRLVR